MANIPWRAGLAYKLTDVSEQISSFNVWKGESDYIAPKRQQSEV